MSTFAKANYTADNYKNFRPVYPPQFYEYIKEHFTSKPKKAVDLGCGTGQATLELANLAENVEGIDNSKVMIEQARKSNHPANISFSVGNDRTFANNLSPDSVDLITVAEAAHWFDLEAFYKKAHEVLRKDGILAIWGYCDQTIQGYPAVSEITEKYSYHPDYLGKLWDQGRDRLQHFFCDDKIPSTLFRDTEYHFNDSKTLCPDEKLEIVKQMTFKDFMDYFRTYSAYHTWVTARGSLEEDIFDRMEREITDRTGLKPESKITVKWNTVYMFGRK